jgi:hypothetical protein
LLYFFPLFAARNETFLFRRFQHQILVDRFVSVFAFPLRPYKLPISLLWALDPRREVKFSPFQPVQTQSLAMFLSSMGGHEAVAILAVLATPVSAFWRLPCPAYVIFYSSFRLSLLNMNRPLVVQRADPILSPGKPAGHAHTIMGANGKSSIRSCLDFNYIIGIGWCHGPPETIDIPSIALTLDRLWL